MKRWIGALVMLVTAAAGLSACQEAPREKADSAVSSAAAVSVLDMTCPGTRWVGRVDQGAACPAPLAPAWASQKLFPGSAALPPPFDQFCLYEWVGAGAPDTTKLPKKNASTPALSWLDRDCMVVATQSDTSVAAATVSASLAQSFSRSVERPSSVSLPAGGGQRVRVAVVDSWPDPALVGQMPHGFGMAAIIDDLTCGTLALPPASCRVKVVPHLALNLVEPGVRDELGGGYYGFQARLARTVLEAVETWKTTDPLSKLIVNISLGWDGRFNAGITAESNAAAAVREAIAYADCQGALVIAAAGNATGGTTPGIGPTYPGAWETLPAPACVGVPTRPLVYAAGGVDGRDKALANVRPSGRPVLAAPAFDVPARMSVGGTFEAAGPFTGSSVSTAVVSAAAALVWNYGGGLSPDQVIARLTSTGQNLGVAADFCKGGGCANIRRVSLCRALAGVAAPLGCPEIPLRGGSNPAWTDAQAGAIRSLATVNFDGSALTQLVSPVGCTHSVFIPSSAAAFPGAYACPSEMLPNQTLWPAVGPQPPIDPCGACGVAVGAAGSTVEIGINELLNEPAYPETITFTQKGVVMEAYDLGSALDASCTSASTTCTTAREGLEPGLVYKVALPGTLLAYGTDFDAATIEWVNQKGTQATSEIDVWNE